MILFEHPDLPFSQLLPFVVWLKMDFVESANIKGALPSSYQQLLPLPCLETLHSLAVVVHSLP